MEELFYELRNRVITAAAVLRVEDDVAKRLRRILWSGNTLLERLYELYCASYCAPQTDEAQPLLFSLSLGEQKLSPGAQLEVEARASWEGFFREEVAWVTEDADFVGHFAVSIAYRGLPEAVVADSSARARVCETHAEWIEALGQAHTPLKDYWCASRSGS